MIVAASGQEVREAVASIRVAQWTENTQEIRPDRWYEDRDDQGPRGVASQANVQPAVNSGVGKNHTEMADMLQAMHASMTQALRGIAPKAKSPASGGVHAGGLQ